MVISSHIEVLTKRPKVESIGEVKKLRSLYDTVESHVRGLEGRMQYLSVAQDSKFIDLQELHLVSPRVPSY